MTPADAREIDWQFRRSIEMRRLAATSTPGAAPAAASEAVSPDAE